METNMETVKLEMGQTLYNVGKVISKYVVVRENAICYYLCNFDGSMSDIQTASKDITQSEFNKLWSDNLDKAYQRLAESYKEKYLDLIHDEELVGKVTHIQEEETSIHPSDLEAIDSIDASVFNGDSYFDKTNMKFFENKLIRWKKELNITKKCAADIQANQDQEREMNIETLRDACLAKIDENCELESKVNDIFEMALEAIENGESVENEVELGLSTLKDMD